MGVNGSWRDSYLFGISNGRELVGGTTHGVSAYVMRDQKIWGETGADPRGREKPDRPREHRRFEQNGFHHPREWRGGVSLHVRDAGAV